jgi:hypothetical protein
MDKTQPYDEPLDPHWELLNGLGPTLSELAGTDKASPTHYKHLNIARDKIVPYQTRIGRAREMASNIGRAIEDGHLDKYPDLDGVSIAFRTFAERAATLGYKRDEDEPKSGVPKHRKELLEIFNLAWVALRRIETEGFPLMEYVNCRAAEPAPIVGTLVITKLPDGTIVSAKHEPLSNEPGVS